MSIQERFSRLGTDNAPGQERRQKVGDLHNLMRGGTLEGVTVDFSHGDVDAFTPTPGSFEVFAEGVQRGGSQAYTEYRGAGVIREELAGKLAAFTGAPIDLDGMILTPGTQGALFLAIASTVARGDKVAIVQPDYFANRKLVEFFEVEMLPVQLNYMRAEGEAGLRTSCDYLRTVRKEGAHGKAFAGVGLHQSGITRQMLLRMRTATIGRVEEHGRWRIWAGKRTVVAHVDGPRPDKLGKSTPRRTS